MEVLGRYYHLCIWNKFLLKEYNVRRACFMSGEVILLTGFLCMKGQILKKIAEIVEVTV